MKFVIDHDLHIHSQLSSCSSHPEQTAENILKYGVKNGLKTVCITDHHWDMSVPGASAWYKSREIYSVYCPCRRMKIADFFSAAKRIWIKTLLSVSQKKKQKSLIS